MVSGCVPEERRALRNASELTFRSATGTAPCARRTLVRVEIEIEIRRNGSRAIARARGRSGRSGRREVHGGLTALAHASARRVSADDAKAAVDEDDAKRRTAAKHER